MPAWKEVEPFLGLLVVTAALTSVRPLLARAKRAGGPPVRVQLDPPAITRKKRVVSAVIAGIVLGFFVLGGVAILFKLPHLLEEPPQAIQANKMMQRERCRELLRLGELNEAELILRNDTLSKTMAREFAAKQRATLDRSIRPVTNFVFFRSGALIAVLPFIVALALTVAFRFAGRPSPAWLPSEADWVFVLLPAIYGSLGTTWAATTLFHFWLRERQFSTCMIISGHWYTACHSAFSFATTLAFIRLECHIPKRMRLPGLRSWTAQGSSLFWYYLAWCVLYLALVFGALRSSQRFYHDSEEANEGIACMLRVVGLSAIAAFIGISIGVDNAMIEVPQDYQGELDADALKVVDNMVAEGVPAFSSAIKRGQVCQVLQDFEAESDAELAVKEGAVVHVLAEVVSGWVQVQNVMSQIGYVPASFLQPTAKEFKLDLAHREAEARDAAGLSKDEVDGQDNGYAKPEPRGSSPETEQAGSTGTINTTPAESGGQEAAKPAPPKGTGPAPTRAVPAFLKEISGQKFNLRHVEENAEESAGKGAAHKNLPVSLNEEILERVKRNRQFIQPSDSVDESNDDSWAE